MKKGFLIISLWLLSLAIQAQAPSSAYNFELITSVEIDPGRSYKGPYSILMSPDRKHLISRSLEKKAPFRVYNVETGTWKDTGLAKSRFSIDAFYFESNSLVYLFIGRKVFQIDLTTATLTTGGCKDFDSSVCDNITSDIYMPASIWRGEDVDHILPGRFEIRHRGNKAYLYYAKQQ